MLEEGRAGVPCRTSRSSWETNGPEEGGTGAQSGQAGVDERGVPSQRPSAARCPGPVTSAGHEMNNSCIPTLWAEGQLGLGMEETHVSAVSLALGRVECT